MARFVRVIAALLLAMLCSALGLTWFSHGILHDQPCWSPDGKRICYRAEIWDDGRGEGEHDYVYSDVIAGDIEKRIRVLLTPSVETLNCSFPQLSSDGRKVAFADDYGVWITTIETGHTTLGISLDAWQNIFHPVKIAWSPDNTKIACVVGIDHASIESALIVCTLGSPSIFPYPDDPRPDAEWQTAIRKNVVERVVDFAWADNGTIVYAAGKLSAGDSSSREYWQLALASMARKRISREIFAAILQKTKPAIESRADGQIWLRRSSGAWAKLPNLRGDNPCLAPDGRRLAFMSYEYKESAAHEYLVVAGLDGAGTKRLLALGGDDGRSHVPLWLPDGRILYNYEGAFYTIDSGGGRPVQLTPGNGSRPVWTPDGNYVLFTAMADGKSRIWLADPATRKARPVSEPALIQHYKQEAAKISDRALPPDGRYLARVELEGNLQYGKHPQINIYDRTTGQKKGLSLQWAGY